MDSQDAKVTYQVTVDPTRLQLHVEMRVAHSVAGGRELVLRLPTWVPGHYAFLPFARDILELSARDASTGEPLEVTQLGWQGFRIAARSGDVVVSYRVAGFEPELGEPVGIIDSEYAVVLGTRYLYCPDHLGSCAVTYHLPTHWEGTLHHPSGAELVGENTWVYPNYEVLLDTPVAMGRIDVRHRDVDGTPIAFVFVDQGIGYADRVDTFTQKLTEVAAFYKCMFGSFPFQDYSFILSLNPQNSWGLEHLTSTMCGIGPEVFTDSDQYAIGIRVCAHEMFHAWNVRRLRPAPLLQLQHHLEQGCFTDGLWMAEGFTRYFEFVSCAAVGVYTGEQFISNIVGYHAHLTVLPAYERVSVAESSHATYLNHSPSYPGQVDCSIDYYNKGMLIAFGIDARLRLEASSSLTEAFAAFYHEMVDWPVGSSSNPGYLLADVVRFFNERLAGLGDQIREQVTSPGALSTLDALGALGFEVTHEEVGSLGLFFTDTGAIIHDVLDDSAAGAVGIAPGDEIVSIDGHGFTHSGLNWVARNARSTTLGVARGHRRLSFVVGPRSRRVVSGLRWTGTEEQAGVLKAWLGLEMVKGTAVPLDFYENFHGIETVI